MNKEEITRAKVKYQRLLEERRILEQKKQELKELLDNPYVKRYLELKCVSENRLLSNNEIIRFSFSETNKEKCDIYVYMGAYICDNSYDSRSDFKTTDLEVADYLLYMNLGDEFDCKYVRPCYQQLFESSGIKIVKFNSYQIARSEYYYYRLQEDYFESLLHDKEPYDIVKKYIKSP